jgi:hypothetical protein
VETSRSDPSLRERNHSANVLAGIHVVVSTCATYGAEWLTNAVDGVEARITTVEERVCAPRTTSRRAGDEPYSSSVQRARCAGQPATFEDESRAGEALAICGICPVRRPCRAWALANAVEVVAGGMTAAERRAWRTDAGESEPTVTVEDFLLAEVVSVDRTWGRGRSEAILNAVEQWTDDGQAARQIGLRLGVPGEPEPGSAPVVGSAKRRDGPVSRHRVVIRADRPRGRARRSTCGCRGRWAGTLRLCPK